MTNTGWICLAVIVCLTLAGIGLFLSALLRMAKQSDQRATAMQNSAEQEALTTTEAAMSAAQTNAAPSDTAVDARLKAGTF